VIVVDNKDITDPHTGQEDEILGIAFCKKLLGGNWKQTSYNGNNRESVMLVSVIHITLLLMHLFLHNLMLLGH
jgi:hypothetical protein